MTAGHPVSSPSRARLCVGAIREGLLEIVAPVTVPEPKSVDLIQRETSVWRAVQRTGSGC